MSEAADTEATRALVLTRLFIEALDARDVDALVVLVAEDTEFRHCQVPGCLGESSGRCGLFSGCCGLTPECRADRCGSETDGTANFEVRDGELAAFAVSSEMLRAAPR